MNVILQDRTLKNHVSFDAIEEFEKSLLNDRKKFKPVKQPHSVLQIAYKIFEKLGIHYLIIKLLSLFNRESTDFFTILMGADFSKCFPFFSSRGKKAVYIFDAWPETHQKIERHIEAYGISVIYFSSFQVSELFKKKFPTKKIKWIPEGIDSNQYSFKTLEQKNIDVLQLGRQFERYHNQIVHTLADEGFNYLYETRKGSLVFPDRESFVDGLARTKISICVPSNVTHPERSGNISTITLRYWQSMSSKCLILGVMPEEMKMIFNYNPIVEIDWENPSGQILNILNNYESFLPLIEQNYEFVKTQQNWCNRIELFI